MTVKKAPEIDVLFLIPPVDLNAQKRRVDRVYGCNYGFDYKPAIHLLTLAAVANKIGCDTAFLDCPAENYDVRKFVDYLKVTKSIKVVVFFTVWLSAREDLEAARIITHEIPGAKIVFTGSYPTWMPQYFIRNGNYSVIRGEPEKTLTEVLKTLFQRGGNLSGMEGLSLPGVDNPARQLENINNIPFPDLSLLRKKYFLNRISAYPSTVMLTSRGCSYGCVYCAPNAVDQAIELEYSRVNLHKPPLRVKDASNVIEEFKYIHSAGYKGVEICDNQFIWDIERVVKICDSIQKLRLKWICCARADRLKNKDVLKLMKDAGCVSIYIGTESFNQEVLDDIGKNLSVRDNYNAVELVRECGISPEISVLFGASFLETFGSADHAIKEARKMKTDFVHYSMALPLPNTVLYKRLKEKGLIRDGGFKPVDNIEDIICLSSNLNHAKLKKIIRKCYRNQYLSLRFIIKRILDPYFLSSFPYRIAAFLRFLKYLLING